MRALPFLVAAVAGVATAFLVACGDDRNGLIPASDAASLEGALSDVAAATQSGQCPEALAALSKAKGVLLNLPDSLDPRLRARLTRGIRNLEQRVPVACQASQPSQQTQETTTTEPDETETTQTNTTPTTTVPSPTTPTETAPTQTAPTTTVPPPNDPSAPSEGTGGAGASAGSEK